VVGGRDRLRFLHAVTTQDVQGLAPGDAAYGALTDDRGRPITDFRLYVLPDAVLLEAPRGTFDALQAGLDKLVVADDVVLAAADGSLAVIEGASVSESIALGAPERRARGWFVPPSGALDGTTFAAGWNAQAHAPAGLDEPDVLATLPRVLEAMLLAPRYGGVGVLDWSGPRPGSATEDEIDAREIAAGRPGPPELRAAQVWNELGAMDAVSFTKGCFMGQEILNRVESQGNLKRRLVRLGFAHGGGAAWTDAPLADASGDDAGTVTRASGGHAFAFVRQGAWTKGTRLVAHPRGLGDVPVEVL